MWWPTSQPYVDRGRLTGLDRRQVIAIGAGSAIALAGSIRPALAAAVEETDLATAMRKVFGDRVATAGKVKLDLPAVAGSGNSVALTVVVDSPMTPADHVKRVHVFAEHNPRPHIMSVDLGPNTARAEIATRIRLSRSQSVLAFAETSDGRLWSGQRPVEVTIGACDSLMFRY